jgi:hypothetical protein
VQFLHLSDDRPSDAEDCPAVDGTPAKDVVSGGPVDGLGALRDQRLDRDQTRNQSRHPDESSRQPAWRGDDRHPTSARKITYTGRERFVGEWIPEPLPAATERTGSSARSADHIADPFQPHSRWSSMV